MLKQSNNLLVDNIIFMYVSIIEFSTIRKYIFTYDFYKLYIIFFYLPVILISTLYYLDILIWLNKFWYIEMLNESIKWNYQAILNNIYLHFGTYFRLIIVPIICEMNEISVQFFNSFNKNRKLEALVFIIQVDSCYENMSEKNLKHLSTYWLKIKTYH